MAQDEESTEVLEGDLATCSVQLRLERLGSDGAWGGDERADTPRIRDFSPRSRPRSACADSVLLGREG